MNNKEGIPKDEVSKLFYKLCVAIAEMKNPQESAELLRDLLSYSESKMIAKRLKIAELILIGKTYEEIREKLKVGYGKIARVQEWLNISGGGYRKAVNRSKEKDYPHENNSSGDSEGWRMLKKKYPMYYWPEMLLEEMIRNSGKKQKEKIMRAMGEMEKAKQKTELFLKINRLLTRK
ncbi:MAG: Trp family transcriptional regulator [Parcubacteria group bacterium]|jgi:uncharacterized protein YerC